jgi:alkylation response protein AidB-like acyl-CoA dehydrogenase
LTIAAEALGIAQGALDYALGYVKERRRFGQAIADFQGLQFMIADMAMKLEARPAAHLRCGMAAVGWDAAAAALTAGELPCSGGEKRIFRLAATSYQPASRYWAFQWTETAIYLALSLALAGYCFRWLNRRLC